MARQTGEVKWFDNEKGYGFIEREDLDDDVFVHHSDIEGEGYKTLHEGEQVEFEIIDAEKGPKALNVVQLEEEGSPAAEGAGDEGTGPRTAAESGASEETGESGLAAQLREKLSKRFLGGD